MRVPSGPLYPYRLPAAECADREYSRRPPPSDQSDRNHPDRRPGDGDQPLHLLDPTLALHVEARIAHYVRAFRHQDRDIMERQHQGLRFDPPLTLIDDADTQAKWYCRL